MTKKEVEKDYVNEKIKAAKILLLTNEGEKIGVVTREEALQQAYDEGLDLVQVGYNPKEKISICKIMDYGKYKYEKKKKEKDRKKNQKGKGIKEIKFGYMINERDLELKVKKGRELLEKGYMVKFLLVLRGRENIFKEIAKEKIGLIEKQLSDIGKSEGIKEERRGYSLVLHSKSK